MRLARLVVNALALLGLPVLAAGPFAWLRLVPVTYFLPGFRGTRLNLGAPNARWVARLRRCQQHLARLEAGRAARQRFVLLFLLRFGVVIAARVGAVEGRATAFFGGAALVRGGGVAARVVVIDVVVVVEVSVAVFEGLLFRHSLEVERLRLVCVYRW